MARVRENVREAPPFRPIQTRVRGGDDRRARGRGYAQIPS